jgi:CDP-4-dehydro-6-deoxyglucose reductase, E3
MAAKPRECRARVVARRALAAEVLEVDLRMEDPPALGFEAGQWVSVPFGPKTVRAYSIASPPRSSAVITLCADVAPDGIGSRWFRALAPGQEVGFKGPLGGFVYSRSEARRPLFVAEEIGIVPVHSILGDLAEPGLGRPVQLVYWARDPSWLVYDDEFGGLARRQPAFTYHPVVAGPAGTSGDDAAASRTWSSGTAAAAVDRLVETVEGLVAYVAGGEATIKAVRDVLMAKGLERKSIKWEKFW